MRSLLSFVWKTTSWSFPLETLSPINCEEKARKMLCMLIYLCCFATLALSQSSGQRQHARPQYPSHTLKKSRRNDRVFFGSQQSRRHQEMSPARLGSLWATLGTSSTLPCTWSVLLPTPNHRPPIKEGPSCICNSGSLLSPKSHTGWHLIAQGQSHSPAFIVGFLWTEITMSTANNHLQIHIRGAGNATVCK